MRGGHYENKNNYRNVCNSIDCDAQPNSSSGHQYRGGGDTGELGALVDEYVACCEAKSALHNSRSEKIRRSALRACKKAAYCKHAKAELVEVMLENNIEPKAYKVRHFLNQRFKSTLQAKE